jgi:Aldehyde dehydrogenase family
MYIDGQWVDALSGRRFDTVDPATEAVITTVPHSGADDVERAVRAARRAFGPLISREQLTKARCGSIATTHSTRRFPSAVITVRLGPRTRRGRDRRIHPDKGRQHGPLAAFHIQMRISRRAILISPSATFTTPQPPDHFETKA